MSRGNCEFVQSYPIHVPTVLIAYAPFGMIKMKSKPGQILSYGELLDLSMMS